MMVTMKMWVMIMMTTIAMPATMTIMTTHAELTLLMMKRSIAGMMREESRTPHYGEFIRPGPKQESI